MDIQVPHAGGMTDVPYTHGHHESVLRSHRWRTAENSAAYLLAHLRPGPVPARRGLRPGHHHRRPRRPGGARARPSGWTRPTRSWRRPGPWPVGAERTGVTFEVGDVFALGFPDDSFDVVHAHQVLQHLGDPVGRPRRDAAGVPARGHGGRPRQRLPGFRYAPTDPDLDRGLAAYGAAHPTQRGPLGRRAAPAGLGPRRRVHRGRPVRLHLVLRHTRGAGVVGRAVGRPVPASRRWPPSWWRKGSPRPAIWTCSPPPGAGGRPHRTAGSWPSTGRCSARPEGVRSK